MRFRGCLSRVPRSERRVLGLRAGVGRLRPHTRTEVARIAHIKRARVITLERRGLRRLRALNRAGACQDAGATTTTAVTAAPGTGTLIPPAGTSGDRGAVLAEHHSSADSKGSGAQGKPERAELSISRPAPSGPGGGGSFDLALVLAPLAVLAFLLVITREVRRAG
jgi:DNA-binding CsgD family transcriptional regulator